MANGDAHQPIPSDPPESDELRWEWVVRLWYTQKDIRSEVLKLRGEVARLREDINGRITGANEEQEAIHTLEQHMSDLEATVERNTEWRNQIKGGWKVILVVWAVVQLLITVGATVVGAVMAAKITGH